MILFVDNDIILKLTACGLFWEAIACLGIQDTDLRVLNSAKFVFEKNKQLKKNYSKQVRETAILIVKKLTQVSASPDNTLITVKYQGLDQGELTLMGEAIKEPSFYLATGDKKCMKTLIECPDVRLEPARQKLMGKVICLEQLIVKLIDAKGFEIVRERITPIKDCDTVLKVAFASGLSATKSNSLLALNDYIAEIEQDCPGLLH